eukprot:TRINITY_DN4836_c0_g1_i1.p1 TRINITY_DN4836_c0_g1~~TRINITY_DN4836_c0_g1_i1.p1  ORF type:complete len:267 (-),score=65.23 TRINITY_DN4836_c0_g1_i1:119-919(-)
MEVQRKLQEQLEVQRHLQLRIEAQGRYLQSILEKARETLAGHKLGSIGLEATRAELSELASKVKNECLGSAFPPISLPSMPDFTALYPDPQLAHQQNQAMDCSAYSCLTSIETSLEKGPLDDLQSCGRKRPRTAFDGKVQYWQDEIRNEMIGEDNLSSPSSRNKDSVMIFSDRNNTDENHRLENVNSFSDAVPKDDDKIGFLVGPSTKSISTALSLRESNERYEPSKQEFAKFPKFPGGLDLNINSEFSVSSKRRELDLNCHGWSR